MNTPEFKLDLRRIERTGLDEAILCADKTPGQIAQIAIEAQARGHRLLLTRLDLPKLMALPRSLGETLDHDLVSRTSIVGPPRAIRDVTRVAVVTAGTSDIPAAREALRTLGYYGEPATQINDVGVAGLWRLTERLDELARMPVVIVAAGMDAAIVSVLGGLIASAIIAVPTSVGYGVAAGGSTALNAMLASCAPGVAVVNIDNGYGAACAALRILRGIDRQAQHAKRHQGSGMEMSCCGDR